jgi:hypothetical protein
LRLLGCRQLEEFEGRTGLWCGAIQRLMTFENSLGASVTTRVCSRTLCTSCNSRRARESDSSDEDRDADVFRVPHRRMDR